MALRIGVSTAGSCESASKILETQEGSTDLAWLAFEMVHTITHHSVIDKANFWQSEPLVGKFLWKAHLHAHAHSAAQREPTVRTGTLAYCALTLHVTD